jgi:hypothetical protein
MTEGAEVMIMDGSRAIIRAPGGRQQSGARREQLSGSMRDDRRASCVRMIACANNNSGTTRAITEVLRVMTGFARAAFRNHSPVVAEKAPWGIVPKISYDMSEPIQERVKMEYLSSLY